MTIALRVLSVSAGMKRRLARLPKGLPVGVSVALAVTAHAVPTHAVPTRADAEVRRLFTERSFIQAADRKCGFFTASTAQALGAAVLQAQGVLLRAGQDTAEVEQLVRQARQRADSTACDNAGVQAIREDVENAFALWVRAARINFPARGEGWAVDRFSSREPGWRMAQRGRVGASPVVFGLAGRSTADAEPVAVVSFKGRARPYAARIVMRNEMVMPRPHLVAAGVADVPPQSARKAFFASGQDAAPASLLPGGQRQGEAWRFAPATMDALERLDPREAFVIEFLFRDDTVARVRMEAGDLAAARSFLSMGPVR